MNKLKNVIVVEGYIETIYPLAKDKYGLEYITFVLMYPRASHSNFFRCRIIKNRELLRKISNLQVSQLVQVSGELIDFMQGGIPKTNIIVKELKQL